MDIALLSANANQLRHALELCAQFRVFIVVLLSTSTIFQVISSILLVIENQTCNSENYSRCNKYVDFAS